MKVSRSSLGSLLTYLTTKTRAGKYLLWKIVKMFNIGCFYSI